ncbi:(2Fe-2S)-binding protein [Rhizobium sp. R693]|uniref:(2Fe-2S)-binding protein n=1 Tax=Rhizobium sp. R693 TaxID=1764276 RepID=UPI000B532E6A|nr:(2Fe-2S)-binding protein [Rhizobium sp. R693]OWV93596.1 (2Fe-2S)-binding protein [Rhizobium sp. R693]
MTVTIEVNGTQQCAQADADTLLIDVIRYAFGLTGTKLGCGTGDCGACTVLLNGSPVNSCLVYALECEGARIETIEGVAASPAGRIIVDEMIETDAAQCGFCTPGIVVTACALAKQSGGRRLTENQISTALAGNLCRCTGYLPIRQALQTALDKLANGGKSL